MEDPEISQMFEQFIQNEELDDKTKLRKMKRILNEFSNRWAEERTLSSVRHEVKLLLDLQKYRDKCYELLEYTQKAFIMIEKMKDQLIYEKSKSSLFLSEYPCDYITSLL